MSLQGSRDPFAPHPSPSIHPLWVFAHTVSPTWDTPYLRPPLFCPCFFPAFRSSLHIPSSGRPSLTTRVQPAQGLSGLRQCPVLLPSQLPLRRSYPDEEGPKHWSDSRYEHVMKLRQAALKSARDMWADYILVSFLAAQPRGPRWKVWRLQGKAEPWNSETNLNPILKRGKLRL